MCVDAGEGRGEREVRRGHGRGTSRVGVFIKKTQTAAQQMIPLFFFSLPLPVRHKSVVGGGEDCSGYLRAVMQNLSR